MRIPMFCTAALLACSALSAPAVMAQSLDERATWYVQGGLGEDSSRALVVGTTRPWQREAWNMGSGQIRGHWDAWLGGWSNRDLNQHRFTTPALGIGPSLRWRGDAGRSPWFAEVGTAIMVTGKTLYNSGTRMGTRWNFASHIGIGTNFGAQQNQQLTLRLQHASNAGIKRPNPGLDFVQLRYARTF